jgi:hypothetical protein
MSFAGGMGRVWDGGREVADSNFLKSNLESIKTAFLIVLRQFLAGFAEETLGP